MGPFKCPECGIWWAGLEHRCRPPELRIDTQPWPVTFDSTSTNPCTCPPSHGTNYLCTCPLHEGQTAHTGGFQ